VFPLQSLHGLFIDTNDVRTFGWIEIELANSLSLLLEVQVSAVEPHPNVMWTELMESQDATDLRDTQLPSRHALKSIGKRLVRPDLVERSKLVVGPLACQLDQLTSNDKRYFGWSTRTRGIIECLNIRVGSKPGLPLAHGTFFAANALRYSGCAHTFGRKDDDPGSCYQRMAGFLSMSQPL
jgi:hypothetical protein